MRTQKAISNIAYHRPEVFKFMTDTLREAGIIGPCLWIAHKAEQDEKKDHIHLLLLDGFKVYDTSKLASAWGVDVVDGAAASVTDRWTVTKTSAISDWLLYGIHDPAYLAFKGKEKEHFYTWADVHCSKGDEAILENLIQQATEARGEQGDRTIRRLVAWAKAGRSFEEAVCLGLVPTGQLLQARTAWAMIRQRFWKGVDDEAAKI